MRAELKAIAANRADTALEEQSVTRSGIVLPDTAKEKPQRGEIVAVGDDEETIKVRPGEVVLYPRYTGTEVTLDGHEHLILEASDLVAVIRTPAAPAVKAA